MWSAWPLTAWHSPSGQHGCAPLDADTTFVADVGTGEAAGLGNRRQPVIASAAVPERGGAGARRDAAPEVEAHAHDPAGSFPVTRMRSARQAASR